MLCNLNEIEPTSLEPPEGIDIRELGDSAVSDLYRVYQEAFAAGDAEFYFAQSPTERRVFFDTLGLDEAVREGSSVALARDGTIVAFTYVLPFGDRNAHVSCMCVLPELQDQGLGKLMLRIVQSRALRSGYLTITLGTEVAMRAYHLYRNHGFAIAV